MRLIKRFLAWADRTLDQAVIIVMSKPKYSSIAFLLTYLVARGYAADGIYKQNRSAGGGLVWCWLLYRYATLIELGQAVIDHHLCHECEAIILPDHPRIELRRPYDEGVIYFCQVCSQELAASNGLTLEELIDDEL